MLSDVCFPAFGMFVSEIEIGERDIVDFVQLEGTVGSLYHAEFSCVFGNVDSAIDIEMDVCEMDVVY